jgi:hypothetical protein
VAKLLLAHAEVGTPGTHGRRGLPTSGYPCTIIYRQVPSGIRVLVVKDDRRCPGYGGGRRRPAHTAGAAHRSDACRRPEVTHA